MSATTWLIIAIVGFSLSGIALAAAVFMFIKLNIPGIIGDLTGKTVAREIKAMRDANTSSGNKLHKPSRVNADRGRLTEKVNQEVNIGYAMAAAHESKRLDKTGSGQSLNFKNVTSGMQTSGSPQNRQTTEAFSTNVGEVDIDRIRETTVLPHSESTAVLVEERSTEALTESRGTEVLFEAQQTEVLSEADFADNGHSGTTVLNETMEYVQEATGSITFTVTRSVVRIHTDEVI